jgi:hypothetical protein
MNSGRVLTVSAIVVWAAVAVTAAPRAFSHRHSVPRSSSVDFPAESCADLHVRFDHHDAVLQSEERTITKAEAPTLRVRAEAGPDAESALSQMHLAFHNGELRISAPTSNDRWAAHLLIRAPKASALDLDVSNGPMTLYQVDGNVKARAENGPITVSGCSGELDLSSRNGPVTLQDNSGKQTVQSENGPMSLSLSGDSWTGAGLEARTTNGPLTLEVPSGYKSGVVLESDGNGPFQCRASVCSEGRKTWDDDRKRVEFGSGPTLVRLSTTNGPISVR